MQGFLFIIFLFIIVVERQAKVIVGTSKKIA